MLSLFSDLSLYNFIRFHYTLNAVIGPVTCVVLAVIVSWITEELITLEEDVDSFQETNLDTLHVDSSQETKLDTLNVDSLEYLMGVNFLSNKRGYVRSVDFINL
ncbi:hypothetical protein Avbf_13174, partial [Armadillidium vulgare]